MPPPENPIPKPLARLAGLLSGPLGGPSAPPTIIGANLVTLALDRHQVGGLLFGAIGDGDCPIASGLRAALEERYRANIRRREKSLSCLNDVAGKFAQHGIAWVAIKGTTQAAQLYADPAWRESADIDILVAPRDFARALHALEDLNFDACYPPLPTEGVLRRAVLGAIRDVTVNARNDHSCAIELHRRLFFIGGGMVDLLRSPASQGAIPVPPIGPDLAFFLIAHGALSYWVRLKWLADLVPLFSRLNPWQCLAIMDLARRTGAESSVAASLLLLRALFPFAALAPLQPWLVQQAARRPVRWRLRRYLQMLSTDDGQKPSPLNNALVTLEANAAMFEATSTRLHLLLSAPVSSVMRRLSQRIGKTRDAHSGVLAAPL